MLKSFLSRLTADPATDARLGDSDARVAVAALLVHASRVDHDYSDTERELVAAILAHRFGLDRAAAIALRTDGEAADAAAVDTYRFTQILRVGLSEDDRVTLVEALWSLVLADDARAPEENEFVRRVVKMLHLEPRQSVLARQRVEAAMGG